MLSGSHCHVHTGEGSFDIENGRVSFIDVEVASLETAGENLGLSTNGLDNFAFQQLVIGNGMTPTTLVLTDAVDNGNRLNGITEVQYLLDINGDGLVLNSGSRLVLNGNDLFVSNGTNSFFSVRDLITPGENSVQFGDGIVALTEDVGGFINPGFESGLTGYQSSGDGTAIVVESPFFSGNSVLEMTAGSTIEITQNVSLPSSEFPFFLDAASINSEGTLEVIMDGVIVGTFDASQLGSGTMATISVDVDDPNLLGAIDVPLTIRWDGNAGDQLTIDNLRFSNEADPDSVLLFEDTPYLSMADSPFKDLSSLVLEDFDDGEFNVVGVSAVANTPGWCPERDRRRSWVHVHLR